MRRIAVLSALLLTLLPAAAEEKPLWLVVGRPTLTAPLAKLAEKRAGEGFEVRIVPAPLSTALEAAGRAPAFLLIVGDAGDIPAKEGKLYRWRPVQRTGFASDALWADRDGDLFPDFPVGRIPAASPLGVARVAKKILDYEARGPTIEDLRILTWAGAPGYGGAIDAMATSLLVTTVRRQSPPWAEAFLLSASLGHPLCGWPPDQPDRFVAEYKRGAALAAVLAHANADSVAIMKHEGKWVGYQRARVLNDFAEGPPGPPLVLLACNCGRFDREEKRCLAESLLFVPAGPVAVVGATTESHPLTNYYSGEELLRTLRDGRHRRLGDLWLETQRRGFEARNIFVEPVLKNAEGSLEAEIDVAKLRRDQPLMYALFGDPATRLKLPLALEAEVTRTDSGWRYRVEKPEGATGIHVGLRPLPERTGAGKPTTTEEEARKVFRIAQEKATFRALEPAWEGEVEGEGTLRLVAVCPEGLRVFTAELR